MIKGEFLVCHWLCQCEFLQENLCFWNHRLVDRMDGSFLQQAVSPLTFPPTRPGEPTLSGVGGNERSVIDSPVTQNVSSPRNHTPVF